LEENRGKAGVKAALPFFFFVPPNIFSFSLDPVHGYTVYHSSGEMSVDGIEDRR
jgi:hypothetical protein